ncbi:MAG: histidine--tRNA ligase [Chlorobiaceae bacterium]|nr:histidine--tRNA ligase [Chlorobiaceae bacterium]NTV26359.1 histidine--tRNA ligase [Chlorobiaceae bacterium]
MAQFQVVKGAKDIFPEEIVRWHYIEGVIRSVTALYGFSEIRTPVFEYTELFQRGIGSTTDIVGKEMFSFLPDPNGRSITLRPEMTAGVMRAFLQKYPGGGVPAHKLYYVADLFRKERPQAGRQRQFTQFGAELLGVSSPAAVAEVISMMMQVFDSLGLQGLKLRVNSLGDLDDRARYRDMLRAYLEPFRDKLDEPSLERFDKNPLRILDSKNPAVQEIVAGAPKLLDCIRSEGRAEFDRVLGYLADRNIAYEVDHLLVRGLDYYGHTAFEVVSSELGAQDALGGGGRYDALSKELGGNVEIPAVGFAVGMERLIIAMEKQGLFAALTPHGPQVFVVLQDSSLEDQALRISDRLRHAGVSVESDLAGRSMKAQMREANRLMAGFALFVGQDEVASGNYTLRNLKTSEQFSLSLDAIPGVLHESSKQ